MDDKQYTEEVVKNINRKLKTKQAALKFDNTPTTGSVNPVTSEGIKEYVDSHQGKTYTAGENITISNENVISAKDTKYQEGRYIYINSDKTISCRLYAGRGIGIDDYGKITATNNVYSNYATNFLKERQILRTVKSSPVTFLKSTENLILLDMAFHNKRTWKYDNTVYFAYSTGKIFIKLNMNTFKWEKIKWKDDLATYNVLKNFDGDNVFVFKNKLYYTQAYYIYVYEIKTDIEGMYFSPIRREDFFVGVTSPVSDAVSGSGFWTDGQNFYFDDKIKWDENNSQWTTVTWQGLSDFKGQNIWTDESNIYYSNANSSYGPVGQYELDQSNSEWVIKNWNGNLTNFSAGSIWTDGENIYYSNTISREGQTGDYVLDQSNSEWVEKDWDGVAIDGSAIDFIDDNCFCICKNYKVLLNGEWVDRLTDMNPFYIETDFANKTGRQVWTDGVDVYFSLDDQHYIFNSSNQSWEKTSWIITDDNNSLSFLTFNGENVFSDYSHNIYCRANDGYYYKFSRDGSSYNTRKYWFKVDFRYGDKMPFSGLDPRYLWTDGMNIYYSDGTIKKVLDQDNHTWTNAAYTDEFNVLGHQVWTDGNNIFAFQGNAVRKFVNTTWQDDTNNWMIPSGVILWGTNVWTDGRNFYYDYPNGGTFDHYKIFERWGTTHEFEKFSSDRSYYSEFMWTDGKKIYCFPDMIAVTDSDMYNGKKLLK